MNLTCKVVSDGYCDEDVLIPSIAIVVLIHVIYGPLVVLIIRHGKREISCAINLLKVKNDIFPIQH